MQGNKFEQLMSDVVDLTPFQHKQLRERLEGIKGEADVVRLIERDSEGLPLCPHCGAPDPMRWGQRHGAQRFRCRQCKRTFNLFTGTPLANLRHKEQWFEFAEAMIEGYSVRKSAKVCGIGSSTSFRWRHRFLQLPAGMKPAALSGIAEADETFMLDSRKGERDLPRKPRERGGKASQRGRSNEQVCILVARDRSGASTDHVLEEFNSQTVMDAMQGTLPPDIVLCTDKNSVYSAFANITGITHKAVNLTAHLRVIDNVFHIQNVNAYHSRLKTWMRRFKGIATRYLPQYLGWFRWLDSHSKMLEPEELVLDACGRQPLSLANTK